MSPCYMSSRSHIQINAVVTMTDKVNVVTRESSRTNCHNSAVMLYSAVSQ